jgi:hypothetical protein
MAESTLSLKFSTIRQAIAHYLGYGRLATVAAGLTTDELADVDAYHNEGMRDFLGAFNWSFLSPVVNVTLWATATGTDSGSSSTTFTAAAATFFATMIGHTIVMDTSEREYTITGYTDTTNVTIGSSFNAGDASDTFTITANGVYRMPDAFGGIVGPITFQNNEGSYSPIELVTERQVAELLQRSTTTARPTLAAQRPVSGTSATAGQRWDLLVYRIPDSDYTVYFEEILLIDQITSDEFPIGGMLHGDTIKYACLAAAENDKNDRRGEKWERYQQMLAKSKQLDSRLHRSERMGVMTDNSDRRPVHPALTRINHVVTVDGTAP